MPNTITIPADTARAIAELAVELKCVEMEYARRFNDLNDAENRDDRRTLEADRACYFASQAVEHAARKVAARMSQIGRFQDRMLGGFEAILRDAHDVSRVWDQKADRFQKRADNYRAQIDKLCRVFS